MENWSDEYGEGSTIRVYQMESNEPLKIMEIERNEGYSIEEQITSELEDIATEETFEYELL